MAFKMKGHTLPGPYKRKQRGIIDYGELSEEYKQHEAKKEAIRREGELKMMREARGLD